MSGAEVLAVVGIIANITALVDFGVEVCNRATAFNDGASNIPKAFRSTAEVLPLVKATLQQTEKRIREGDLDIESCQGLTKVLHSCLEALAELNNIFQSVLPKQDASKLTKFRKAISSIRQDKKVEVLEKALRGHIDVLTFYFSSQTLSITQISQAVNSSSERDNSQRKPLFLVRYPKEKDFVGREDVMLEISQRFEQNVPRVAICGIGGVGKSRIAIEYSYQYKDQHPTSHIFWVYGGSHSRMAEAYHEIARELRIPGLDQPNVDVLTLVSDWLSEKSNGPFLMILDNADDAEIWEKSGSPSEKPLINILPRADHGSVLITTRNSQLGRTISKHKSVEVNILNPEDSVTLLQSKISEGDELTEAHSKEIIEILGCLPLAITQAAAYLGQIETSVAEYLELLRSSKADEADLLVHGRYDDSRDPDIPNAVFHTWKVSFEQISRQSPRAGAILSTMALLDRQAVPLGLLREEEEDELDIREAVQKLKSFSLITEQVKNKVFGMHRLVQLSIQWHLKSQRSLESWQEKALACVVSYLPDCYDDETLEYYNLYLPHAYLVRNYKFTNKECQCQLIELVSFLGSYHSTHDNYKSAVQDYRQMIELQKSALGEEHENIVKAMLDLGDALAQDGDGDKADQIFDQALILSEHMSADIKITVFTKCAENLADHNNFEESHSLYQQAVQTATDHYGHKSLRAAQTMINVSRRYTCGNRYDRRYEYQEAEKLQRQAIAISKALDGDSDEGRWRLHEYMSALAETLNEAGSYFEALELEETIMSFYHTCQGPTARKADLASRARALDSLRKTGQLEKAEGYGRDILRLAGDTLEHDDTLFCELRERVARCFDDLELYDEAEILREANIETSYTSVLNASPFLSSMYKRQMIILKIRTGRYEEAHDLLKQLLEKEIVQVPRFLMIAIELLKDLAREMGNNGRMDDAEAIYREILVLAANAFGAEHHETFNAVSALAKHLQSQGKVTEAETLYCKSIELGKVLVLSHSELPCKFHYMSVVTEYKELLKEEGRYMEAKALLEETVAVISNILDDELTATPRPSEILGYAHKTRLLDIETLGGILFDLQETEKAESLCMEALQLRQRAVTDSVEERLTNMLYMVRLHVLLGKEEEREKLSRDMVEINAEKLGRHHEDTLADLRVLAFSCSNEGEREALFREVLDVRLKKLGPHHQDTIQAKADLAKSYGHQDKFEEAEILLREILDARIKTVGTQHPSTATAMLKLAYTLDDQKKLDGAEKLYREVVKMRTEVLGPTHHLTLGTIYDLGWFLHDHDRFEEAIKLHREVLSATAEVMGLDHRRTILAMRAVGRDLTELRQYEEAESYLRQALAKCKDILGHECEETVRTMRALGEMLLDSNNVCEGREVLTEALPLALKVCGSRDNTTLGIQELLKEGDSDPATSSDA
ncbi:Kinesin light chain [Lachnellula hyalina]|uniref:Kinesin light chain n=1 Tax=Lachnellula hyalina TaxID=1316788 RepID=A0A8H8RAF3_9HELO|nr:Kinesin light chain [Lachnellula hyalina]TVY29765.1 Kinesin light chain [Lachnellula hyalina]